MVVILESVIFVGLPDAKIDFQAQEEEVFSRRQLKSQAATYRLQPTRCNVLRATN